jgi:flagellar biosynthesis protein FlhA
VTSAAIPLPTRNLLRDSDVWLAFAVITVIALLVLPLPAPVLDVLLASSIGVAIIVLLVTLSCSAPLDFSVFPSLLLLLTLFRLGLNVSSTRLILSQGHAGRVIEAFGSAVIGGNYVVGLVMFLILVVINFVVITKGAGRIAEVAARFTLDAMPGRQMSIDADLSAGIIDEAEARRRREEINRYADFYGAMDGAAKFVRGDAIAGLIITGINLVGGFIIGMAQRGLSASEALSTYSRLTVGDGLVTQIPALIVSTSAGIIVSYGSSGIQVAPAMLSQLSRHPKALWSASVVLAVLGLVPGFPTLPFTILAASVMGLGFVARGVDRRRRQSQDRTTSATPPGSAVPSSGPPLQELLALDPLELEVGYGLVPLVDEAQGGDMLRRVALIRKQLATELGFMVPAVRIRDNIQLPATEYRIKLRGLEVARGEILPRYLLALNSEGTASPIDGIQGRDPAFGIPAVWIPPARRLDAEAAGYRVVEPSTVLATHLLETIKRHAGDLLGRQETKELVDAFKQRYPALVDDLVPSKVPLGLLHRVLQRLLREGVPIRDLATILETVADAVDDTKDPEAVTERVRHALGRTIAQLYEERDGTIRTIGLGPRLEAALATLLSPRPKSTTSDLLEPGQLAAVLRELQDLAKAHAQAGRYRPLLAPSPLRVGIRRLIEPVLPELPVVSMSELPPDKPVHQIATWELPRAA